MEKILGRLPSNFIIFSTLLSVLIPMVIYKLTQKLHDYGDPPWKKQEKNEDLLSKNNKDTKKTN